MVGKRHRSGLVKLHCIGDQHKYCKTCNQEKLKSDFNKNKTKNGGLAS